MAARRDTSQQALTAVVAVFALLLTGLDEPLALGVSTTTVVTVALAPLWLHALPRFAGARLLTGLTLLALTSGLLLAAANVVDHTWSPRVAWEQGAHVVTWFLVVGLVLWVRELLSVTTIVLAFTAGALASGLMAAPASTNPWKYQLGVPVALAVLALLHGRRSLVPSVVALAALAAVGISQDHRSYFGFCLAAGLLLVWQAVAGRLIRAFGQPVVIAATLVFGVLVYRLATFLLTAGYLGGELQQRSAVQVRQSGSLILGGRPEWTGTWQLMSEQPLGFGLGIVPNPSDVAAAVQGLVAVGLTPGNGYIHNYMFGGRFQLHSILADLWVSFGVAGLVLGAGVVALMLRALVSLLAHRQASALLIFITLIAMWDMAFAPIQANLYEVALALGLLLLRKPTGRPAVPPHPVNVSKAPRRAPPSGAAPLSRKSARTRGTLPPSSDAALDDDP